MRSDEKICRQCHGRNPADSTFCWYCGGRLRGQLLRSGGRFSVLRLLVRGSKWLIALAALAGLAYGVYYALDRVVWPAVSAKTTQAAIVTSTSVAPSTTTTTTTIPRIDRQVAGGSRYVTAIEVSKLAFPAGAPSLVLVVGDDSPYALAVGPLAAAYSASILLMPPEGLGGDLSEEIKRLAPKQVFLVGINRPKTTGGQLGALLDSPEVTNLTGGDPYETAANIAAQIKTKLGKVSKVVIAPSDSFLEAISVSPLASAQGWPILLTPKEGDLPGPTSQAITDLGATSALIVGTTVQISQLTDVLRELGTDSFATAALVLQYALEQGGSFEHTAIATGDDFPDGLVAGSLLAPDKGMLLLARAGQLPPGMLSLFGSNSSAIRTLDFIGLPALAKAMAVPGTGYTDASTDSTDASDTSSTDASDTSSTSLAQ